MNDHKRSVSLEDLLQLKRGERPPETFWAEFDRQLRAKQLAALVGKRPWWQRVRLPIFHWSKWHLPIGTTAAMAVTFLVLRDSSAPTRDLASPTPSAAVVAASNVSSMATFDVVAEVPAPSVTYTADPVLARGPDKVADAQPAAVRPVAGAHGAGSDLPEGTLTGSVGLWGAEVAADQASPSARFIAANLAAAQESISPALLSEVRGFESRALPARPPAVEPLQQISVTSESRRVNRFLTAMVSMPVNDTTVRSAERMANRISVDELYDQPHRFGTRRGGVNMKF